MSRESFDTSVLGEFFWNSTDLLSVLGSDGTWQIVNAAWPEQMGWTLEDLQSGPFIDLIHPDDVLATVREFDRLVAAPDATLIEFRNRQRRRDGSYRWIEWSCQGRNGMVFSAGRDITGQVEAQLELAGSLETQRAILDAVVDSIITVDEQFQRARRQPRHRPHLRRLQGRTTRQELAQHRLARGPRSRRRRSCADSSRVRTARSPTTTSGH